MNVNKKLDRFKQWAGERMGGEVKTNTSEDFKMLETEMTLRHDGTYTSHTDGHGPPAHRTDKTQAWRNYTSP